MDRTGAPGPKEPHIHADILHCCSVVEGMMKPGAAKLRHAGRKRHNGYPSINFSRRWLIQQEVCSL